MKKIKSGYALLISLFYLATHLVSLVILPVFADESIYIRWSQLIIDDWSRYLFFPLNDGKTPLFVWMLVPFQFLAADPLLAGRLVAVGVGLGQVLLTGALVKKLGGSRRAIALGMILTSILPFWFLHHRLALMDGLLTFWLTAAFLGAVELASLAALNKKFKLSPVVLKWVMLTGLFIGLAFWTKLPAVLFLPLLVLPGLIYQTKFKLYLRYLILIGSSIFLGLVIFAGLKIHPAFGQLFSRGSDFLYPVKQVLLEGKWQDTVINFPTYFGYFKSYLSLPVILMSLAGLFSKKRKRTYHILLWSALVFILPIGLLGKVVYARYFLPAALFFTVSSALAIDEMITGWIHQEKKLQLKLINSLLLTSVVLVIVQVSLTFMVYSWVNPSRTPFVQSDGEQYLLAWSSGHGITQTVNLIQSLAQDHPVAVATEGYFGTLPDAVLMYLHRRDVSNIYVEGIGVPVSQLPASFILRSKDYDQVLLVVNSHRLNWQLPPELLKVEYCRPYRAPCLQVWDVTSEVNTTKH